MTTLVTGGAGFLGSHVVDYLLAMGHEVVIVDDLSGGCLDNVPESHKNARIVVTTITNTTAVEKLFDYDKFDYVFHLAAYAAEGLSHFIRRFNYTNNLIGSVNLINASVKHKVKCFVFTSSIAVYGSSPELPLREDHPSHPEDPYGISKHAVELDLKAAHEMFGLDYIIFRPHNVYGERQNIWDPYRNVIGIFMNQILQGKPCTIFGDGCQSRAFTHVHDVAPIIATSIENKQMYNEAFNIGADKPERINTLHHHVVQAMGRDTGVEYLPARKEVLHAYSDHSKLRKAVGGIPDTPLQTGLRWMANWAKSVEPRKSRPFGAVEIEENLPESWRKLL